VITQSYKQYNWSILVRCSISHQLGSGTMCAMRGDWPPTFEVEYRNLDRWSASLGRSCWNDDHFISVLSWLEKHMFFDGVLPTWFEKPSKYMYLCSWDFSWDFLLWNMMIINDYKVLWWVFCMDYVGTMYVLRIFCIGFCRFLTSPCVEPILVSRRSIAPCCTSTSSDCPTTKTETVMW
jgi:hypothetical protein